ncbi:hypothetical protein ON010_g8747 [Phytophthora cinnamomi]|nr:hypothetical protein ON010_g8747 [Phytophthora cinnamomi]
MPVEFASPDTLLDIELEVVSAKGIDAGDYLGLTAALKGQLSSSDAYVSIEIDGQIVAWTRPIFDTLKPEWNEKFVFKNVQPSSVFKLSLFDKDMDADDELGEAQFIANTAMYDTDTAFDLPITMAGRNAGTLSIKQLLWRFSGEFAPRELRGRRGAAGGRPCALLGALERVGWTSVHADFQRRQTRVLGVPRPAAQHPAVFADGPRVEQELPDDPAHLLAGLPGVARASPGSHDATRRDLLARLEQHHDKPVLFTYVITKKGWYFSETGASFFKDMLSKHMLHSGAAFSVLYAGEFRIDNDRFDEPTLVIDNNSGTYAPPADDLPQLQALMENNFPGINCVALDQHDETLQETRKEILAAWE